MDQVDWVEDSLCLDLPVEMARMMLYSCDVPRSNTVRNVLKGSKMCFGKSDIEFREGRGLFTLLVFRPTRD